ncbi:MAG: hypothetical protein Q8Q62_05285 [Mesorhizobium sp.]|nr:hypothetical protein [Mesorhizobium sp.]
MGSCRPTSQMGGVEREQGVAPSVPAYCAPEEVFLAWLLWLPEGADMATAARREIARIDRVDNPADPLVRLRTLLAGVARGLAPP